MTGEPRDSYGLLTRGPRAGTHTSLAEPVYLARHLDTLEWVLYVYTSQTDGDGVPMEYCEMPARPHLVKWMRQGRARKAARFLREEGLLRDDDRPMSGWRGWFVGLWESYRAR